VTSETAEDVEIDLKNEERFGFGIVVRPNKAPMTDVADRNRLVTVVFK